MSKKQFVESRLDPETATVDEVCPAGEPWVRLLTEKTGAPHCRSGG